MTRSREESAAAARSSYRWVKADKADKINPNYTTISAGPGKRHRQSSPPLPARRFQGADISARSGRTIFSGRVWRTLLLPSSLCSGGKSPGGHQDGATCCRQRWLEFPCKRRAMVTGGERQRSPAAKSRLQPQVPEGACAPVEQPRRVLRP